MKCIVCEKEFDVEKNHGGQNRKICYECLPDGLSRSDRNNLRRKLFYEKAKMYKLTLGCCRCGYNKCADALEWHHTDGDDKLNNSSDLLNKSWESYIIEIVKCILLCANCHREEHNK